MRHFKVGDKARVKYVRTVAVVSQSTWSPSAVVNILEIKVGLGLKVKTVTKGCIPYDYKVTTPDGGIAYVLHDQLEPLTDHKLGSWKELKDIRDRLDSLIINAGLNKIEDKPPEDLNPDLTGYPLDTPVWVCHKGWGSEHLRFFHSMAGDHVFTYDNGTFSLIDKPGGNQPVRWYSWMLAKDILNPRTGFYTHDGGECPVKSMNALVMYRNGEIDIDLTRDCCWDWEDADRRDHQIIGYREI